VPRSSATADAFRPPEGEDLLERLRGRAAARPAVDPGLAGGLRDWLEDGLADVAGEAGGAGLIEAGSTEVGPVRVTKETLTGVLLCEAHLVARRTAPRVVTVALARGSLVDALFRQWGTTGRIDDPWSDALGAVAVGGDVDGIAGFIEGLPADRRRVLAEEIAEHAAGIVARWPVPSPTWLARTQERVVVPLAGGRVVVSGVVDLAVGGPAGEKASVCVVEIKSGRRRVEHRGDLHFYALLETLRSGAPPFRIATYYTRTGELDVEAVTDDVLVGALERVLAGAVRLCRLAAGSEPARTPNGLCAWCSDLPQCAPGRAKAGTDVPRTAGDTDDDDDLVLVPAGPVGEGVDVDDEERDG
jgi:hypothetical protein